MINNDINEKLVERLIDRIEELNEVILTTIGKRIKQIGNINSTQIHQIKQMLMYSEDINKIAKKIAYISNKNISDIYQIFEEEAKINQDFAKQYYMARGVKFVPYIENKALQNQVKAIATITAGEYVNLAQTQAIGYTIKDIAGKEVFKSVSNVYRETIDNAILNITQGKTTYQQEMRNIINQIGTSGLKTVDYATGTTRRLDSAVRMNVLGGMRQLTNELQNQFGKEYGADGVEISVHVNPAPDHENIQGHQYSFEEYNKLNNELERHISEYNCYHYIFNIVLGINKPEYTQEQLDKIIAENNKGFEIDGKHYTNYEGTQLQRRLETKIREQKDLQILGKASGDKEIVSQAQKNITNLTTKYKQLSNESGLPTKMQRLSVVGYKRINVNNM